MFQD